MSVKDKLKSFIKESGLTISKFEKSIGAGNGYVNNISKSIGGEYLEKIREVYPDLDVKWLLSNQDEKISEKVLTNKSEGVPYYENIEATASIISQNDAFSEKPTFYINYEHFNDCNAYIPVVGDSMYPKYCSGEIIAVKRIYNFDVIQWGEAYFIVTNSESNDMKTIKLLHQHEDDSKVILRSSNPNYKGDTTIHKKDIISLFIVKGRITRNQL